MSPGKDNVTRRAVLKLLAALSPLRLCETM